MKPKSLGYLVTLSLLVVFGCSPENNGTIDAKALKDTLVKDGGLSPAAADKLANVVASVQPVGSGTSTSTATATSTFASLATATSDPVEDFKKELAKPENKSLVEELKKLCEKPDREKIIDNSEKFSKEDKEKVKEELRKICTAVFISPVNVTPQKPFEFPKMERAQTVKEVFKQPEKVDPPLRMKVETREKLMPKRGLAKDADGNLYFASTYRTTSVLDPDKRIGPECNQTFEETFRQEDYNIKIMRSSDKGESWNEAEAIDIKLRKGRKYRIVGGKGYPGYEEWVPTLPVGTVYHPASKETIEAARQSCMNRGGPEWCVVLVDPKEDDVLARKEWERNNSRNGSYYSHEVAMGWTETIWGGPLKRVWHNPGCLPHDFDVSVIKENKFGSVNPGDWDDGATDIEEFEEKLVFLPAVTFTDEDAPLYLYATLKTLETQPRLEENVKSELELRAVEVAGGQKLSVLKKSFEYIEKYGDHSRMLSVSGSKYIDFRCHPQPTSSTTVCVLEEDVATSPSEFPDKRYTVYGFKNGGAAQELFTCRKSQLSYCDGNSVFFANKKLQLFAFRHNDKNLYQAINGQLHNVVSTSEPFQIYGKINEALVSTSFDSYGNLHIAYRSGLVTKFRFISAKQLSMSAKPPMDLKQAYVVYDEQCYEFEICGRFLAELKAHNVNIPSGKLSIIGNQTTRDLVETAMNEDAKRLPFLVLELADGKTKTYPLKQYDRLLYAAVFGYDVSENLATEANFGNAIEIKDEQRWIRPASIQLKVRGWRPQILVNDDTSMRAYGYISTQYKKSGDSETLTGWQKIFEQENIPAHEVAVVQSVDDSFFRPQPSFSALSKYTYDDKTGGNTDIEALKLRYSLYAAERAKESPPVPEDIKVQLAQFELSYQGAVIDIVGVLAELLGVDAKDVTQLNKLYRAAIDFVQRRDWRATLYTTVKMDPKWEALGNSLGPVLEMAEGVVKIRGCFLNWTLYTKNYEKELQEKAFGDCFEGFGKLFVGSYNMMDLIRKSEVSFPALKKIGIEPAKAAHAAIDGLDNIADSTGKALSLYSGMQKLWQAWYVDWAALEAKSQFSDDPVDLIDISVDLTFHFVGGVLDCAEGVGCEACAVGAGAIDFALWIKNDLNGFADNPVVAWMRKPWDEAESRKAHEKFLQQNPDTNWQLYKKWYDLWVVGRKFVRPADRINSTLREGFATTCQNQNEHFLPFSPILLFTQRMPATRGADMDRYVKYNGMLRMLYGKERPCDYNPPKPLPAHYPVR